MGASLRAYILRVIAASLLSALTKSLIADGGVRRIASIVCAALLFLCVLSPLAELDLDEIAQSLAQMQMQTETLRTGVSVKNRDLIAQIIKQRTQTYILDKAAAMGLTIQADVTVQQQSEYPYPWQVTLRGACTQAQKQLLTQYIEENLAIPADRQVWDEP